MTEPQGDARQKEFNGAASAVMLAVGLLVFFRLSAATDWIWVYRAGLSAAAAFVAVIAFIFIRGFVGSLLEKK